MDGVPIALFDIQALQTCLRERLAVAGPRTVTDVLRAFLDVSALPTDRRLWSLEFAFDEDDGRTARLVATFSPRDNLAPEPEDLLGYEVHVLLPKFIAPRPAEEIGATLDAADGGSATAEGLVVRFLKALVDLGAYRTIERLEVRNVDVFPI